MDVAELRAALDAGAAEGRYPVAVSIGADGLGDEITDDVVSAAVEDLNGCRRLVLRVAGGVFAPLCRDGGDDN